MRVLITGAFGQLGFALSQTLSEKYDVMRTDILIPPGQTGIRLHIQNQI